MTIVFVDWTPIKHKSDIRGGIHIRRYYAWVSLNKMANEVIPFRKENGKIHFRALHFMLKTDSKIWVEYGCGRIAHLLVLFTSFLGSKNVTLNIHDFIVQQGDIGNEPSFFRKFHMQTIEWLLLKRANVIILPCPGMLDYFTPRKYQKVFIMPPGVGKDELFFTPSNKNHGNKNIALYFGSMQRKGIIPIIIELFSKLNEWELHLVGPKGEEEIFEKNNVKYLGFLSHNELYSIINNVDVILIPSLKNDYLDNAMNIKLGYALKSCKPVIATKLKGISKYISMLGLEENVIYIEEWNLENLKTSLKRAQSLDIDTERTIGKLKQMAWELRFEKTIEIALNISQTPTDQIEWV